MRVGKQVVTGRMILGSDDFEGNIAILTRNDAERRVSAEWAGSCVEILSDKIGLGTQLVISVPYGPLRFPVVGEQCGHNNYCWYDLR